MSEAGAMDVVAQAERENACGIPLPFRSVWAFNGLDDACPHWLE
jgi:hypothetical protein